jgi:photosystem II stability/assembly factor-like uncharacterized protein
MKKFIIALLIFVPQSLNAQWEILNEGFKGQINSIDFVNDNVGWIAGRSGTLVKTTDGGENWINITINESWNISTIDFVDESIGWLIRGAYVDPNWTTYILKSSNGGDTWYQQFASTEFAFNSIYIVDANNVYAVGGNKIYKTTNGGTNWINISPNLPDRNYNSLWFLDSQTGVVVGSYYDGTIDRGIILRTTNAGTSWDVTIVNEFNFIYDLQFLDDTHGYFRANHDTTNYICKTVDMLASWTITSQYPYSITSYQYIDNNNAYAIMGDSIASANIMKSTDGGNSWLKIQSIHFWSNKVYFTVDRVGFILCNIGIGRGGGGGVLYSCTDGTNWIIDKFYYAFLNNVNFINKNKGFIFCGYNPGLHSQDVGHIFSTLDGGESWNCNFSTDEIGSSSYFLNDFVGYSLFSFNIYKTTNSGYEWNIFFSNNPDSMGYWFWGNDIYFANEATGFIIGRYEDSLIHGAGVIITTDAGVTWNLGWQYPDSNDIWHNLYSITSKGTACWVVGESGFMVRYTPQTGWVKQTSVTDLPLNKIFFTDDNHGWIAGGYQNDDGFQTVLLKTTDAGANWYVVPNIHYLFKDISFIDNNLGWAIGYDSSGIGGILETIDGGITWFIDTGNLPAKLNALHIKDNYGWAVGENGLILRTTNAGAVWVEDESDNSLPTEFVLEQNYPNPFNPSTKIKYQIPNQVRNDNLRVTLKVYDVLGREVAALVDAEKPAGNYEVEFNVAHESICAIASGIYFYRLTAGSYTATKKMLLLK